MFSPLVFQIFILFLQFSRFQSYVPKLYSWRRNFDSALNCHAQPSSESIDKAVYAKDPYKVLGVSRNASKKELRDAYWALAFQNHPDRNKSQAALEIFRYNILFDNAIYSCKLLYFRRNASYAYKILGRNSQSRHDYDNTVNTKVFIDLLEEVGTEIMMPLAMEVAVPLINLTVKSIGSFAMPYIRDAYEQSIAIFQAAFDNEKNEQIASNKESDDSVEDEEEDDFGLDYFSKATKNAIAARDLIGTEQKIRRLSEQLDKIAYDKIKVSKQIQEAAVQKDIIEVEVQQKSNITALLSNKLDIATR